MTFLYAMFTQSGLIGISTMLLKHSEMKEKQNLLPSFLLPFSSQQTAVGGCLPGTNFKTMLHVVVCMFY